jgi:putative ABC transport system permease protein
VIDMNDIRYAIRTLGRSPGFTVIVILTLALGIGANTAIFSVVHAVLLRPLPYARPVELMSLYESLPASGEQPARPDMAITPATTRDWAGAATFSSIAYYAEMDFILTGAGEPSRIGGANVSWAFFDTLGVPPAAGRPITRADDQPDQPPVCVIGHDLWRARFGSDQSIVGKQVELSGTPHTVVGIAQPGFAFPSTAQIWTPLALPASEYADDQRLSFYLRGVGRLKSTATPEQAATDLNLIATRMAAQFPAQYKGRGATVVPLQEAAVASVRPALMLLLGTVACVLLIACVNVANLLLARGASRTGEMATRAALGASRGRMIRQLLTESAILSIAGAIGGILLAMWARDAIVALSPASVPRIDDVQVDLSVLGFALGLATITALAFGLVPALLTAGRALGDSIAGTRKGNLGTGRQRIRAALVVAQLALSLALLTGAGLLARTLWNLISVDPGFDSSSVMTMEVVLPRPKYQEAARRAEFFTQVVDTLQRNPLVIEAGGSTNLPLSNTNMSFGFYREDMTPGKDVPLIANVRGITAGYFGTLGIPLIRGRAFTQADRPGSQPVVVINDAMRRKFWPNQDPLGQQISITRGRTTIWREIVGIVGDIRHTALGAEPEPEIYMPYAHDPFFHLRIAVRSSAQPDVLAGAMRAAVWAIDPAQPVSRVRSMDEVVASSVASQRFNTILIGTFAAMALALAAVGLYGVIAYSVTLRRHEFGLRLALGAGRHHVLGLVVRQALLLAAVGLVLGFGLALATTRLIETQLYRTTPTDPLTYLAVALVLLVIAVLASYVPARRAVNVDPMTALRAE